ncbi:MAG: N-acetylneuraminate synthase family protein [Pseudomonadota bacterium]
MTISEDIPFGQRRIGTGHPVCIMAEIGINHEGSVEVCARMIEAAARAGADSVKLQTIDADANYVRGTESHTLFSTAWLTPEETAAMFDLARTLGMEPFTTAGDPATLEWVERLEPAAHKISSGLLTHLPIVRQAARTGRTLLVSTGMSQLDEVDEAMAGARAAGAVDIGLFQCTSVYPAPPESANLAAIRWLAERFGVPAGYSDHTLGDEVAALSVAAGAVMVEKHFTLDTTRPGYDHPISLDEAGFAAMVRRIRAAEAAMGRPGKVPVLDETDRARRFRRILVALTDIPAGAVLGPGNLGCKRPLPGTAGLPPRELEALFGRRTARPLARDEAVTLDCIEAER